VVKHPSGLVFEIIEADKRKVKKVLIRKNVAERVVGS